MKDKWLPTTREHKKHVFNQCYHIFSHQHSNHKKKQTKNEHQMRMWVLEDGYKQLKRSLNILKLFMTKLCCICTDGSK